MSCMWPVISMRWLVLRVALALQSPTQPDAPPVPPIESRASDGQPSADAKQAGGGDQSGSNQSGIKNFAPGVRIDWPRKAVEVEARVVLREGPLELVLCTVGSKEHESILATAAKPRDIFQAMGLIGLEPGKPVRWDESGKKLLPPEGQKLSLNVHYTADGREVSHPVEKWLMTGAGKPVQAALTWVFSGSRVGDEGRLGADAEGTIICVVDFETAVISVGGLHAADDEQLWLRANPQTIPDRGAACRLTIAAVAVETVDSKSDAPTSP